MEGMGFEPIRFTCGFLLFIIYYYQFIIINNSETYNFKKIGEMFCITCIPN